MKKGKIKTRKDKIGGHEILKTRSRNSNEIHRRKIKSKSAKKKKEILQKLKNGQSNN